MIQLNETILTTADTFAGLKLEENENKKLEIKMGSKNC
jgi:hypothetical protein